MPGTRTAPTVDGLSPTYKEVQIALIDYTGDVRSDTYMIDAAATSAQVEALVAAVQTTSNASVWKVTARDVYEGDQDSQNAVEVVWENIRDNLVIQAKDTQKNSQRLFIPAPINDLFVEGTENIDPANAQLVAVLNAYVALLSAGYTIRGARFTHRRQINQQIKF